MHRNDGVIFAHHQKRRYFQAMQVVGHLDPAIVVVGRSKPKTWDHGEFVALAAGSCAAHYFDGRRQVAAGRRGRVDPVQTGENIGPVKASGGLVEFIRGGRYIHRCANSGNRTDPIVEIVQGGAQRDLTAHGIAGQEDLAVAAQLPAIQCGLQIVGQTAVVDVFSRQVRPTQR